MAKELQQSGESLTTAELRDKCDAFSEKWIGIQRSQFKRLGVLGDWENEYKTKNPAYEAEILRTLASFIDTGLVYRAKKPVYWSIPFKTALAEAEIEYREHTSPSIWVAFDVPHGFDPEVKKPISIAIWTTTPWTIPANLAIALNPKIEYAFIDTGERTLIVAKELAETFAEDCGIENWKILKTTIGSTLEGVETRHPFVDRASPIVMADYVTTESGTGCVHTAPGHGLDDYLTGQKYGMEIYCPVNDDGVYEDDGQIPDYLVSESVLETNGWTPANGKVMKALADNGALLGKKKITHSSIWHSFCCIELVIKAVTQGYVQR